MDKLLVARAVEVLQAEHIDFSIGRFVTVSCTTGTAIRGAMMAKQYNAMCENMEGAAVARVCSEFNLPCLEVRCISNMVEDRDTTKWQLQKACRKCGKVAAAVVGRLGSAD